MNRSRRQWVAVSGMVGGLALGTLFGIHGLPGRVGKSPGAVHLRRSDGAGTKAVV